MLTSDLVRVRRKKGALIPQYIQGDAAERLLPVARFYGETFASFVGRLREELDTALRTLDVPARDRVAALGLRKIFEDRAEFEAPEGVDPEAIRREVFLAAAEAQRALDMKAELDRGAVIAGAAARLGASAEAIEAGLFADLPEYERVRSFEPLAPGAAIERYNLGLAQAVILRATRVVVTLTGGTADAARVRSVFRAARFHGLIHVVKKTVEGYTVELDGPFSLFDAVQKYGLRLALFLPSVLALHAYKVEAHVLWGKERAPFTFEVTPEDGLVGHAVEAPSTSPDLEGFPSAFEALSSEWGCAINDVIFALPGEVVCVPDLVFQNKETGEEVFLEAFGFWSRAAVWQRVELVRKGFPARIVLAVGKHHRVSEEVLGEEDAGEIYVYKTSISPRAVLTRLRREAKR